MTLRQSGGRAAAPAAGTRMVPRAASGLFRWVRALGKPVSMGVR